MPKVFEKESKINVIEYGEHCFQPITFKSAWNAILSLFRA